MSINRVAHIARALVVPSNETACSTWLRRSRSFAWDSAFCRTGTLWVRGTSNSPNERLYLVLNASIISIILRKLNFNWFVAGPGDVQQQFRAVARELEEQPVRLAAEPVPGAQKLERIGSRRAFTILKGGLSFFSPRPIDSNLT